MAAAYVQHKFGLVSSGAGGTLVMPGNTVAGNTIVVLCQWSYAGTNPSFTDSQGNTYTSKGTQPAPSGGQPGKVYVFTAPVGSSAACTLTLGGAVGVIRWAVAIEVSGLMADPYDQQNVNTNTANPCTAGSITTTADGEFIAVVFWRGVGATSYAPGSGWTEREEFGAGAPNGCLMTRVQTTAGAINADTTAGSVNGGYPVNGYVASFKATATGSATRRDGITKGLHRGLAA